jgi:cyclopropane fatty-acyl-phospholipid synthase-like methyltransferase
MKLMNSTQQYRLEPKQDYRDNSLSKHFGVSERQLVEDTAQHFKDCHNDYLFAWCNRDNLAFHYGYWDEATPYQHHQALLNKNQLLYDKINMQSTDRVLDAGCGVGGSSIWMAEQYQNRVTGISITPKQVDYARQQAKRRNVSELADFEVEDFCNTSFEDESFDVIWASESVCHTRDKGAFLKEAYRLLRSGGRLVFCDAFMVQREFDAAQWQVLLDMFNGWAVPNLCYGDEFEGLLKEQHFNNIQVENIHAQTRQSCEYMYKVTKRLYPVQKISEWLRLRSKAQTANYQVGLAQYEIFEQRYAEHSVFTATKG